MFLRYPHTVDDPVHLITELMAIRFKPIVAGGLQQSSSLSLLPNLFLV
jgi:hypothetical protein